jgi:hypothetical protein
MHKAKGHAPNRPNNYDSRISGMGPKGDAKQTNESDTVFFKMGYI